MADLPVEIAESLRAKLSPEELAALGVSPAPAGAAGFTLKPGAPLPAKLRDYYRHPLKQYETVYGRGERTIKRWVSTGRHADPPEPPPLDEPARMAAWYRKHIDEQNVPEELLALEKTEPAHEPAASANKPRESKPAAGATIQLDDMQLGVDEEVLQMQSLVAAHFQRVRDASAAGNSDEVRRWTTVHAEAVEQLRKTRSAVIELKRKTGDLLPKAQILAELAQMLEANRLMRLTMADKVEEEMSKRASGRIRRILTLIGPLLRDAIAAVRAREDDVLLNVEVLRSQRTAEAAFSLAA